MTPEYSGVIESLFERFLQNLVSQDLIGRQQAVQILRASNGSQAEVTEPTQEDQQEQKTEFMEVDPKNSELTHKREGHAPRRKQGRSLEKTLSVATYVAFEAPREVHSLRMKRHAKERVRRSRRTRVRHQDPRCLRRGHVSSTVLFQFYSMIVHSKSPLPCLTILSQNVQGLTQDKEDILLELMDRLHLNLVFLQETWKEPPQVSSESKAQFISRAGYSIIEYAN
jgi:hypothetical protein